MQIWCSGEECTGACAGRRRWIDEEVDDVVRYRYFSNILPPHPKMVIAHHGMHGPKYLVIDIEDHRFWILPSSPSQRLRHVTSNGPSHPIRALSLHRGKIGATHPARIKIVCS